MAGGVDGELDIPANVEAGYRSIMQKRVMDGWHGWMTWEEAARRDGAPELPGPRGARGGGKEEDEGPSHVLPRHLVERRGFDPEQRVGDGTPVLL